MYTVVYRRFPDTTWHEEYCDTRRIARKFIISLDDDDEYHIYNADDDEIFFSWDEWLL